MPIKPELYAKIAPIPPAITFMSRILIVKTSSLGDVVHNLPVITDIRNCYPDMVIDWVVEESFAEIPALHPAVDRVIPVALRRWRHALLSRQTWREISEARFSLKARNYDLILDTQGLIKSALIARQANAPWHGYIRSSIREPMAAALYTKTHIVSRHLHAVTRNRQLAALALDYPLPETPPDYGVQVPAGPVTVALPASYIVALHATSRDSKLWPERQWIELGKATAASGIPLLLPWGNDMERQQAQRISAQVDGSVVLPRLGITDLAGILGGARATVGVDTGLVHLSVAIGVPTIGLYTDTDPGLTGTLPGNGNYSANLGGVGKIPQPADVLRKLKDCRIL